MKTVDSITLAEISEMAEKMYGTFVKGVVDLDKNLLAIDAEMHADIERDLLDKGSRQQDLWGVNLYPDRFNTDQFIEFSSMINIRPEQKNVSRYVENADIRQQIADLVMQKVSK